jgi:hypothetical protein
MFHALRSEECTMPYTVWSRGRLVGETEFSYPRFLPHLCAGDFVPIDEGEKLMPVATASPLALRRESEPGCEEADLLSAFDRFEALALELRGHDGQPIATEWIAISDIAMIMSFVSDDDMKLDDFTVPPYDPEFEPELERDLELVDEGFGGDGDDLDLDGDACGDWMEPREFPRYQILVELIDPASVQ